MLFLWRKSREGKEMFRTHKAVVGPISLALARYSGHEVTLSLKNRKRETTIQLG